MLEAERAYLQRVDDDAYRHVWLGAVNKVSDALIFKGKFVVEEFTPQPHWSTYHGMDFGHSVDPCAAIRCHVADRVLYISAEFWALRCGLEELAALIEAAMPGSCRARLYCDSSRPESIAFIVRHGFPNAIAAPKWSGSVVDGILFLRSFERIVISPACPRTLHEFRSYQYVVDRLTGQPTTEPKDADNHLIDAARYGLSSLIRQSNAGRGVIDWYGGQVAKLDAAKVQAAAPAAGAAQGAVIADSMTVNVHRLGGTVRDLSAATTPSGSAYQGSFK